VHDGIWIDHMHYTGWRLIPCQISFRLQSLSVGVLATGSMSWLKRFRGKRPKSNDASPDASSQPTLTTTVPADLKGKKPAQNMIAAESEQVGELIMP
jgi:hypothetical protein